MREDSTVKDRKPTRPEPPIVFILPRQPAPDDTRPRNAFGYLEGFGAAYREYYERRDREANGGEHVKP
jgi:hypothetical protein